MKPTVCVLLCTYNGEKYLKEQLESVLSQEDVDVTVIAHDDGSQDRTKSILAEYAVSLFGEEHYGAAKGFLYLLSIAPDADYYAFCDQDDVWDADKLITAVRTIESQKGPALYACGTRIVDEKGTFIVNHLLNAKRTPTSRMLYPSISGNTLVMNGALRGMAVEKTPETLIMHDTWLTKLCLGIGGYLHVDEQPHLDYRMHADNVCGMELTFSRKIQKFFNIIKYNDECEELYCLKSLYDVQLTSEWKAFIEDLKRTKKGLKFRVSFLKKQDIDFQNVGFNIAVKVKILLGRV